MFDADDIAEELTALGGDRETPERALAREVFFDGIGVLLGRSPADDLQKARDWVWLDSDSDGPYSFKWCCRLLDLNGKAIREKVRKHARPDPVGH